MTQTQARVLEFIRKFIGENGYSPSISEIAKGVGSYNGTIHTALKRLGERGYLQKGRGWRNIRVIEGGINAHAA